MNELEIFMDFVFFFSGDLVLFWFSSSPANVGNVRNLGSCRRGSVDSGFERVDDEIIL